MARSVLAKASNFFVSLLPSEIIEWEILPRLPVKSLLRFKSVCKSWNFFISSNNDFIKSHLDLNPNEDSLVLEQADHNGPYNSFISRFSMIIGCINGLVCVARHLDHSSVIIEFAIWNPATNQCLNVPVPSGVEWNNVLLGFGFDFVANDYKVVCANLNKEQPAVNLYSCRTACWKKIAKYSILYSGNNIHKRNHRPTIVNGCPFWLSKNYQDGYYSLVVISFDIRHEVFRLLPTISYNTRFCMTHVLVNFRDSLAIMGYNRGKFYIEPLIDVYIFDEKCSVWNKISTVTFMIPETYSLDLYEIKLSFRNGDILYGSYYGCRLYSANPETRTIKILKEGKSQDRVLHCCNYSESLIFIEGMKPVYGDRDEGRFKFLLKEELELARSYKDI